MSFRLKSKLLIRAAIKVSESKNKIATVLCKGDENNGVIWLKLLRKDNRSRLLGRYLNEFGKYEWKDILIQDDIWLQETLITDRINKEVSFDPDLWVLEIETDVYWNPLENYVYD